MSFTQAMQPQAQQAQQPNVAAQMHQAVDMVQRMLMVVSKVPGLDQAKFQQAVQMMQQATTLIAQAMPQGQGQGQPPPGM